MPYTPTVWVDVPDPNNPPVGAQKLNAANLNKMESGIQSAQAGVDTVNAAKGANNGFASLDSGGKVPTSQLPSGVGGGVATILHTTIDQSSSGDNVILGPDGTRKIRVVNYVVIAYGGAVDVQFISGQGGGRNPLSGPLPLDTHAGISAEGDQSAPLFSTDVNEGLYVNLSAATRVTGHLSYFLE